MSEEQASFNISVTFRHTDSTPALKAYAEEKVEHCLRKYISREADVHVILLVEKRDHIAEIVLRSKGHDVTAKGITGDLYSAIDKVIDNVDTQLRKQKERMQDRHHQGATPI